MPMLGAAGALLGRLLDHLPHGMREQLLELAGRLRRALFDPLPGAFIEALTTTAPRLLALAAPLIIRFIDEPRVLLSAIERVQPALLTALTWLESHPLTAEQLDRALHVVSEQIVALLHGEGATQDGERLLGELEELTRQWLEAISRLPTDE